MRMIIFLVAAILATSMSLYASADSSKGLGARASATQNEHPEVGSRCARKITTSSGEVIGCLMQKRRARAA